jgi:hypothetical protein
MWRPDAGVVQWQSVGTGRTGLNGVQLTAAWDLSMDRVKVYGMSGRSIISTLRSDINRISDYYQDFSVRLGQVWVRWVSASPHIETSKPLGRRRPR